MIPQYSPTALYLTKSADDPAWGVDQIDERPKEKKNPAISGTILLRDRSGKLKT
jgi:hypothetical protein